MRIRGVEMALALGSGKDGCGGLEGHDWELPPVFGSPQHYTPMPLTSDNWALATELMAAGRGALGARAADYATTDALADAIIDAGGLQGGDRCLLEPSEGSQAFALPPQIRSAAVSGLLAPGCHPGPPGAPPRPFLSVLVRRHARAGRAPPWWPQASLPSASYYTR